MVMTIRLGRSAAAGLLLVIAIALVVALAVNAPGGQAASRASATATAPRLVGIRAAHHPGFDRVVFQFTGALPSRRQVRYVDRLIGDPSGRGVRVAGRAILEARFFPAVAHNSTGQVTARGRVAFALPNVMTVVRSGDFEAVLSYGIGLAKRTSFHVSTLARPSRVQRADRTGRAHGRLLQRRFHIQHRRRDLPDAQTVRHR